MDFLLRRSPSIPPRRCMLGGQMDRRTVVVIPCYDEAERLDLAAFRRFVTEVPDAGLLFVDDRSRDDTRSVIEILRREHPDAIAVLALPSNVGKGEAVR